jgi:signal transduction histidine kinase/CheY-like chemotaxis protein
MSREPSSARARRTSLATGVAWTDVPRWVVPLLGTYTVLAGLVSFAGWAADVPRLADWNNDGISIQPNTTIAAMAAGVALLLVGGGRRAAAAVLGGLVGLIGVTAFFENVSAVDLGIDTRFMFGRTWGGMRTLAPGRMGIPASSSWTLTGTALILLLGGPRARRVVAALGLVITSIAALSLTGYVFGADPLYSVPWLTAIASQTSAMLFAVGIGLMAAVPEHQPMRGLLEDGSAGVLTRRVLPFIIVLPVAIGYVRLWGQKAGLYDTAMGTAMLILVLILLLCAVLWWGAAAVRDHELTAQTFNAKLQTSVRELEAVFRAAPIGIAIARDADCRHVGVNAACAAMLGLEGGGDASLTGPEAAGLPFRILDEVGGAIPPPDLPLQRAARTGEPVFGRRMVVERADGTRLTAIGSAVPVQGSSGAPAGAIAVFIDVTAEHEAAAERERLLALAERAAVEAEAASRAKDEFLAVLSHELRSPLNAMLGWVHILRRSSTGGAMVTRAIDTLERNVWAQAQVINDLLDISRITSGKLVLDRARVDLAALVAGTVESMRPMVSAKRLMLEVVVPRERLDVGGEAARLQQVVGNVLHNAIKFTPEGGRIAVRLRARDGRALVEVEDTGQGIDPALLPHVFDRFVQSESSTTRRHGGLGLGLAIAKQLTVLHGGTVHAHSDGPGRGARITVTLPLASAVSEPDVEAAAPVHVERAHLDGLDVLLVEDDGDSREALGIALEEQGARVRRAASVHAALAAYDAHPPDVLISDIGMPGEDGYALMRAIREREGGSRRRTLAIAMTGFASRQDHEVALRAGFDDHVGKPVEPAVLIERVNVLAARRRAAQRSST